MRFTVVTLFPELFDSPLAASLLGKARAAGLVEVDFVNPRDFTSDRHRTVDDTPYGGGHGMVMKPEPLLAAIERACEGAPPGAPARRILLTPAGAPLDQAKVRALSAERHLVLVCGRYEGVDERVSELAIDEEISVGDFVMTGGELPALCLIDAVSRLVPGVLGELASTEEESFSDGATLEYPQYTRPPEFRGLAVPEILLGGHHERVRAWRRREALRRTAARRPELIARRRLAPEDMALVAGDPLIFPASRTTVVLAHHPVFDRTGDVVTSSVTNLDIHDIARSCATYGLASFAAVTPVAVQREKIQHIVDVW
ncbi:MAG TPA: tRNA (guanosine(37)-N1)-methyltransferase TrmD, partial [Kofleriaceae bacterium]|nr:tRNA (guanosine(37)-N1)-methyltransferase TrmD [Kofleriaceae bacterium]